MCYVLHMAHRMFGNPVGSSRQKVFPLLNIDSYILGLWSADGYLRSSSFGLTSIYPILIDRFRAFLRLYFDNSRIKVRKYLPMKDFYQYDFAKNPKVYLLKKAKHPAYQIYVNCRPFIRPFFNEDLQKRSVLQNTQAYFAGRFDGDGSVSKNLKNDFRIAYTTFEDAQRDQKYVNILSSTITSSIYHYEHAKTFVLYIHTDASHEFLRLIEPYSAKAQKLLVAP